MVVSITSNLVLDVRSVKTILDKLYDSQAKFPIENIDTLAEALGGKEQLVFVNDDIGEMPVATLARNSIENIGSLNEPNQIIDSLIGDSYINIITKLKLLDILNKLEYPIETKNDLIGKLKELMLFGIPVETIADKIEYPIERSEIILNRIKLIDRTLLEVNTDLIINLQVGKMLPETDLAIDSTAQDMIAQQPGVDSEEEELARKIKDLIERGKNAYRDQQYQEAIEIYDRGLDIDPRNTELRFLKNSVQAKINDLTKKSDEISPGLEASSALTVTTEPERETIDQVETQPPAEPEIPETPVTPDPLEIPELPETPDVQEPPEVLGIPEVPETLETPEMPETAKTAEIPESQEAPETIEPTEPTELAGPEPPEASESPEASDSSNGDRFELDNKLEELEKRLQEKVSALKNLAFKPLELPENACKSCEGKGDCYWCNGSGKCSKCSGMGKDQNDVECVDCKGSGVCHSCTGAGKCHWCNGTGVKEG